MERAGLSVIGQSASGEHKRQRGSVSDHSAEARIARMHRLAGTAWMLLADAACSGVAELHRGDQLLQRDPGTDGRRSRIPGNPVAIRDASLTVEEADVTSGNDCNGILNRRC